MKKIRLLFLLLAWSNVGFSDVELLWRKIDTQYTYKDTGTECSTKTLVGASHHPGEAYVALEIENGKVIGGRFSNYSNIWPYQWIYKAIDLEAREIASIEVTRDKKNQTWLKKFTLSERLARWLVHFPAKDHYWCPISFLPESISPSSQEVVFETEGLEMGIELSYSDWVKVSGKSPAGNTFEESIRLVQRKADK